MLPSVGLNSILVMTQQSLSTVTELTAPQVKRSVTQNMLHRYGDARTSGIEPKATSVGLVYGLSYCFVYIPLRIGLKE
jgi:hypothetical protein